MKTSRATLTSLLLAVVLLGVGVSAASAATTTIGAVNEIAAGADPSDITSGGFVVQVGEAAGTYAVPAGYGVITAWSHSTGTAPGSLTFKVYRPTGAPKEFRAVAADPQTVAPDTNHAFPVQIPVRAGDRIGLSSEGVQLAFQSGDPADRVGFFSPDPPLGATDTTDGNPFESYKLDVAATVESDLNRDGLGDDSQRSQGSPGAPGGGEDSDDDGISDVNEAKGGTNPLDRDSDDDGLADGTEDRNRDGEQARKETSPRKRDTDRDRLTDGVERGVRKPVADPPGPLLGTARRKFSKDNDPRTRTNPLKRDSDGDGRSDGREDSDRDGKRDRGETNPRSKES